MKEPVVCHIWFRENSNITLMQAIRSADVNLQIHVKLASIHRVIDYIPSDTIPLHFYGQ